MPSPDILSISFSAFITVFLVLSVLALFMQVIMRAFPFKETTKEDLAIFSAIATVHSKIYPGTKITKIEELKWYILNHQKKYE